MDTSVLDSILNELEYGSRSAADTEFRALLAAQNERYQRLLADRQVAWQQLNVISSNAASKSLHHNEEWLVGVKPYQPMSSMKLPNRRADSTLDINVHLRPALDAGLGALAPGAGGYAKPLLAGAGRHVVGNSLYSAAQPRTHARHGEQSSGGGADRVGGLLQEPQRESPRRARKQKTRLDPAAMPPAGGRIQHSEKSSLARPAQAPAVPNYAGQQRAHYSPPRQAFRPNHQDAVGGLLMGGTLPQQDDAHVRRGQQPAVYNGVARAAPVKHGDAVGGLLQGGTLPGHADARRGAHQNNGAVAAAPARRAQAFHPQDHIGGLLQGGTIRHNAPRRGSAEYQPPAKGYQGGRPAKMIRPEDHMGGFLKGGTPTNMDREAHRRAGDGKGEEHRYVGGPPAKPIRPQDHIGGLLQGGTIRHNAPRRRSVEYQPPAAGYQGGPPAKMIRPEDHMGGFLKGGTPTNMDREAHRRAGEGKGEEHQYVGGPPAKPVRPQDHIGGLLQGGTVQPHRRAASDPAAQGMWQDPAARPRAEVVKHADHVGGLLQGGTVQPHRRVASDPSAQGKWQDPTAPPRAAVVKHDDHVKGLLAGGTLPQARGQASPPDFTAQYDARRGGNERKMHIPDRDPNYVDPFEEFERTQAAAEAQAKLGQARAAVRGARPVRPVMYAVPEGKQADVPQTDSPPPPPQQARPESVVVPSHIDPASTAGGWYNGGAIDVVAAAKAGEEAEEVRRMKEAEDADKLVQVAGVAAPARAINMNEASANTYTRQELVHKLEKLTGSASGITNGGRVPPAVSRRVEAFQFMNKRRQRLAALLERG